MEKVYVVTAGSYSDYHIEAVFKSEEKAELYCECHDECEIEEYDFSDKKIYTTFNSASLDVRLYGYDSSNKLNVRYHHLSKEDDWYWDKNETYISMYGSFANLHITRKLPDAFDAESVEDQIIKTAYDIKSFVLNELSQYEESVYKNGSYSERKQIEDNINLLLSQKYVE